MWGSFLWSENNLYQKTEGSGHDDPYFYVIPKQFTTVQLKHSDYTDHQQADADTVHPSPAHSKSGKPLNEWKVKYKPKDNRCPNADQPVPLPDKQLSRKTGNADNRYIHGGT